MLWDILTLMSPLYKAMEAASSINVDPKKYDPDDGSEKGKGKEPAKKRGRPAKKAKVATGAAGRRQQQAAVRNAGARRGGGASSSAAAGADEDDEDEEDDDDDAPPDAGEEHETYLYRVARLWVELIGLHVYLHQSEGETSTVSGDIRRQRAKEVQSIGRSVEEAFLAVIGTGRKRTYGHDTVYGLSKCFILFGKPYLGAAEGNERAHQETRAIFEKMISYSHKKMPAVQQVLNLILNKARVRETFGDQAPRGERTKAKGMGDRPTGRNKRERSWKDHECFALQRMITEGVGLEEVYPFSEAADERVKECQRDM
jgi:hypothetical protein